MNRDKLLDMAWYQTSFWALLLSAGGPSELLVCLTLLCALMLLWRHRPSLRPQPQLFLTAILLGPWLDFSFAQSGMLSYASALDLSVPVWILTLWVCFAQSLSHSLAPLLQKGAHWAWPLIALGGPLAYLGGVRLGAASLQAPTPFVVLTLSAGWLLLFAALRYVAQNSQALGQPKLIRLTEGNHA